MRWLIYILMAIFSQASIAFGFAKIQHTSIGIGDTLYVYKTQNEFIDNKPSLVSPFEIKAGSLNIYSRLWSVANSQDMKVQIAKDSTVIFKVGEIFAFNNKGQLYVFIPAFHRYMTLVYRSRKVFIYMDYSSSLLLRFAR